jgi:hypothetical protein
MLLSILGQLQRTNSSSSITFIVNVIVMNYVLGLFKVNFHAALNWTIGVEEWYMNFQSA